MEARPNSVDVEKHDARSRASFGNATRGPGTPYPSFRLPARTISSRLKLTSQVYNLFVRHLW
ncbi:hypothetical protein ANO14919_037810 [Xylariales sp. No.14919]|nr:hypothetical protein ANO14919_037810 [Xylariales sp. No.14919]